MLRLFIKRIIDRLMNKFIGRFFAEKVAEYNQRKQRERDFEEAKEALGISTPRYSASEEVTRIFEHLLESNWNNVEQTDFYTTITTDNIKVSFWSTNKYYAYAKEGYVKNLQTQLEVRWYQEAPDLVAMWKVVQKLENHRLANDDLGRILGVPRTALQNQNGLSPAVISFSQKVEEKIQELV